MKLLLPFLLTFCILSADVSVNSVTDLVNTLVHGMVKRNLEYCAKKTNATKENIAEVLKLKIPASHEGKCMLLCVNQKLNGQKADGSTNINGAIHSINYVRFFDKNTFLELENILIKCQAAPKDSDLCIYAANIVDCIIKGTKAAKLERLMLQ